MTGLTIALCVISVFLGIALALLIAERRARYRRAEAVTSEGSIALKRVGVGIYQVEPDSAQLLSQIVEQLGDASELYQFARTRNRGVVVFFADSAAGGYAWAVHPDSLEAIAARSGAHPTAPHSGTSSESVSADHLDRARRF